MNEFILGTKYMTERFRVFSLPDAPLKEIPPQRGFTTFLGAKERVKILDGEKQAVGYLFPLGEKEDDPLPVCSVTESHKYFTETNEEHVFPSEGIEPFLCEVSFGVKIHGFETEVVVVGPRIVRISNAYVDSEDNYRTIDAEIIEMYLYGYDHKRGALITVRGGRNFGLPLLPGQIKPLSNESDFPAKLFFDLELEVIDWGMMP